MQKKEIFAISAEMSSERNPSFFIIFRTPTENREPLVYTRVEAEERVNTRDCARIMRTPAEAFYKSHSVGMTSLPVNARVYVYTCAVISSPIRSRPAANKGGNLGGGWKRGRMLVAQLAAA